MCLAPCFAGCTNEEYTSEVARSAEALATAGASLESSLEREREAASAALDFERAAALHKKLEKVSNALKSLPELARRVDQLDAVVLQRAAEDNAVAFFPVHNGIIADPFFVRFAEFTGQPRSVEAIIRKQLEDDSLNPVAQTNRGTRTDSDRAGVSLSELRSMYGLHFVPEHMPEHLSLLARWFYAKPREGEIFFWARGWPYRRLLRACARILAPPETSNPSSQPA